MMLRCTWLVPAEIVPARALRNVPTQEADELGAPLSSVWNAVEFAAFRLPYDRRVDRFADAFATVHRLLRDGDPTLQPPARRVALMVGSNSPRMLSITLPHVDAWNTWYSSYGNTAEGFEALHTRIGIPQHVERSACALVVLDGMEERPVDAPPITSSVRARVDELGDAGADEVILVASPCTERSVRRLGDELFG